MMQMDTNQGTKFKVLKLPRGRWLVITTSLPQAWVHNWSVGLVDVCVVFGCPVRKLLGLALFSSCENRSSINICKDI